MDRHIYTTTANWHLDEADGKEVDEFFWYAPDEARDLPTNPSYIEPLGALESAHASRTWPADH